MRGTRFSRFATALGPALLASGVLLIATPGRGAEDQPQSKTSAEPLATDGGGYLPVYLPDPGILGFRFPEDEPTILRWVKYNDQDSMSRHAWGLWTAVNMPTDQIFEGQRLSVLETWVTPEDLLNLHSGALAKSRRDPRPMTFLRQFAGQIDLSLTGDQSVLGFVKYDPTTAKHILVNRLLWFDNLNNMLRTGLTDIPAFPPAAISLKIQVLTLPRASLAAGRYFAMSAWPGPPDPPVPFPTGKPTWKQCIWVDTQESGMGTGTGQVDPIWNADGTSRTNETTYGLGCFIHFRQSATQAQSLNALRGSLPLPGGTRAAEGDLVIARGLHITTKEIANWTWQTFWWTPDPDHPLPPSSTGIAACRPAQLQGAARHYAAAIGYSMVFPPREDLSGVYPSPQAHSGDSPSRAEPSGSNARRWNVANSVYCYNPYIEAGFTPAQLPVSKPGTYLGRPVDNNVGVQTNCMSCHAQACFPITLLPGRIFPLYTGDQDIDLHGPQFKGKLRVDFLWTLNRRAE